MLKVKQLTLVALVAVHSTLVSARKSDAWNYGYLQARQIWNEGDHEDDCTLDSVAITFGAEVCNDVIKDDCEETYKYIPGMEKDCKKGAETFILDKLAQCVQTKTCHDLGETVAGGIAASYCIKNGAYGRSFKIFPKSCENAMIDKCRTSVEDRIESYKTDGGCDGEWPLGEETKLDLRKECKLKARELTKSASLPPC